MGSTTTRDRAMLSADPVHRRDYWAGDAVTSAVARSAAVGGYPSGGCVPKPCVLAVKSASGPAIISISSAQLVQMKLAHQCVMVGKPLLSLDTTGRQRRVLNGSGIRSDCGRHW